MSPIKLRRGATLAKASRSKSPEMKQRSLFKQTMKNQKSPKKVNKHKYSSLIVQKSYQKLLQQSQTTAHTE